MSFHPGFTTREQNAFASVGINGKFVFTNALGDQVIIEQLDHGVFGIQSMKVNIESSRIGVGEATTTKRVFSDYCTGTSEDFLHPITNPKKAKTTNFTNESQSLSRKRSHSEEPEDWPCAKRLKHRKNTNAAYIHRPVELGEELPEMPAQFTLKNEPRESREPVPVVILQSQPSTPISKPIPEIIDLSGSSDSNIAAAAAAAAPSSSATIENEIEGIEDFSLAQMGGDNEEAEPDEVISARRIPKANAVKKLAEEPIQEETAKSDPQNSARIEPTTPAITPAASDEQEQKVTVEAEISPKKETERWDAGLRYFAQIKARAKAYAKAPLPKSVPSTPQSTANQSRHMKQGGRKTQPGGGGVKPYNSLGKDRFNTDGRDSGRQGNSAPGFDLHQKPQHARSRPEHPNNGQRAGNGSSNRNGSVKRNGTSGSPVDVERSQRGRTAQSNNGTNYSASFRNGSQKEAGVQEFSITENIVKPGSRSRVRPVNTLDSRPNGTGENSQQKSGNAPPKFIFKHGDMGEIQGDPIVSDDPEIIQLPSSTKRGTRPVVELPPYPEAGTLVIDQGPDTAKQPRAALKGVNAKSYGSTAVNDGRTSAYFPPNQNRQQASNSSRNRSGQDSNSMRSSLGSTNRNFGKLDPSHSRAQEGAQDDNLSLDELAGPQPITSDTYNKQVAQVYLNGLKKSKKPQPLLKSGASRDTSIALDDDSGSEDEDRITKGAIKPTPFASSKRRKVSKTNKNGDEEFEVLQVFGRQHKWFVPNGALKWSMLLNTKSAETETLIVLDNEGVPLKHLIMQPRSITKIELSDQSPTKMILHKTKEDQIAEGEHQIMIELGTPFQLKQFITSLEDYSPLIRVMSKEADYCDKVFRNILSSLASATKASKPIAEDVDRIAKILEKKNAKLEQNIQENKRTTGGRRLRTDMTVVSDLASDNELTRPARRNLRAEHQNEDGLYTQSQRPELAPKEFKSSSMAVTNTATTPGTRTSSRLKQQEQEPSQRRPKSPVPSYYIWTEDPENAEWSRLWRKSVIYPQVGKKKTTVDQQDIQRLDEGEFLNDNLIHFYFNYLEQRLVEHHPETAKRILFMNSFFYLRLTSGGFNYEAVERWTSKFNIFEYDYIVVPVNESAHWYLAIICNTPKLVEPAIPEPLESQKEAEVGKYQADQALPKLGRMTLDDNKSDARMRIAGTTIDLDDDQIKTDKAPHSNQTEAEYTPGGMKESGTQLTSRSPKGVQNKKSKRKSLPAPRKYDTSKPRIITLDSLGSPHSATCRNLFRWLQNEAQAKLRFSIPDTGPIGMTAKNLPQQPNFCDCGVFLLIYLEKFLEDPSSFAGGILTSTLDVDMVWPEAPKKRHEIRGMLLHLQNHPSADTEQLRQAGIDHARKYAQDEGENINVPVFKPIEPEPPSRSESRSARNSAGRSRVPETETYGTASAETELGELKKAVPRRSPQSTPKLDEDIQAGESGQRSRQLQEQNTMLGKPKSSTTDFILGRHDKPATLNETFTHDQSSHGVLEDPSSVVYQTIENHEAAESPRQSRQHRSNTPPQSFNQVDLRSPSTEDDTIRQRNSNLEYRQATNSTKGIETPREQSTEELDGSDSGTFTNEKQITEIRDSHDNEDEDEDEAMLLPNGYTPIGGDAASSSLLEVSSVAEASPHSIDVLGRRPRSASTSPASHAPDIYQSTFAPPSETRKRRTSDIEVPQSAKRQRALPSADASDEAVVGKHRRRIKFDDDGNHYTP